MSEIPHYIPPTEKNKIDSEPNLEAKDDVADTVTEILENLHYKNNKKLNGLVTQTIENFDNRNYEEVLDLLNKMTELIEDESIEDIFTLIGLVSELL